MATINVSNSSQLQSALAQANGGDTILLANGNYGTLNLSADFSSKVTIKAANSLGATFNDIDISGGSNIHLDGLVINGQPRIEHNAHHITITNSALKSGVYFRDVDNLVVHNNDIGGGHNTITMANVTNFEITENYIHDAQSDIMQIKGATHFGLIENNTLRDTHSVYPDHPDMIQMFGTSDGNPTDLIFRGNYLYDDPSTGHHPAQGFFFADAKGDGYQNLLIEQNLINVGSPHGITLDSPSSNVIVQDNTIMPWPSGGGGTIILANNASGAIVRNNIVKIISDDSTGSKPSIYDNYVFGRDADLNKLFSGDGGQWQDFIPVEGSPIDLSTGLGAVGRLMELRDGTSYNNGSSAQTPAPDPDTGTGNDTGGNTGTDTGTDSDQSQLDTNQLENTAFSVLGTHDIKSSGDVIEVAHNDGLELQTGTIALSFNADTVSGKMGLISKDASYYSGGGNHLAAYIENGTLIVRFQDGSSDEIARISGVKANTDYDLQISFGDNNVAIWLDGQQVHSASFAMTWENNVEALQIGALGWGSNSSKAGFSNEFDGTISDIVIIEGKMSPSQMQDMIYGTPSAPGDDTPSTPSNTAPDAKDDNLVADQDMDLVVKVTTDLLANDIDANGDAITLTSVNQPASGTLTDNGDGTYTYTPNAGFSGTDSFTYTISDGIDTDTATARIVVNEAPPAPPAENSDANLVYQRSTTEFYGRKKHIINLDHDQDLELTEGTVSFTFNADDLKGQQGLISKDAKYYDGGGHHMSILLRGDDLQARFQDEDSDMVLVFKDIKAHEDYDVQVWFGDGMVGLAVDGELVDVQEFDFELSTNKQNLQIGGLGWSSTDGGSETRHAFDGTMSEIMIFDEAMPLGYVDLLV